MVFVNIVFKVDLKKHLPYIKNKVMVSLYYKR